MKRFAIFLILFLTLTPDVSAQFGRFGKPSWGRGYSTDPHEYGRGKVPEWPMDKEVRKDCFTFARLRYRSWTQRRSFNWYTDYRDSDLNFSFRLHELTAM